MTDTIKLIVVCTFAIILSAFTNRPPENEVGICHKCGQEWAYKLIKESALQGHLNHGDFLYRGRPDVYPEEMDEWCNINAKNN